METSFGPWTKKHLFPEHRNSRIARLLHQRLAGRSAQWFSEPLKCPEPNVRYPRLWPAKGTCPVIRLLTTSVCVLN